MNGLGIYTTWTVIASLLNLGHALKYISLVSMKDTSNLCLSLLLVFSVLYFLLENSTLDQKLRFLLTPYLGENEIQSSVFVFTNHDTTILDNEIPNTHHVST